MRLVIILCSLSLLIACSDESAPNAAVRADTATLDANILARHGERTVTVSEFDARLMEMPAAERPASGSDLTGFYKNTLREMIVQQRLLAMARAADLAATEDFERTKGQFKRTVALDLCVHDRLGPNTGLTQEGLRAEYESAKERFVRPERRSTYHLFRRFEDGVPESDVVAFVDDVRGRALRGANFPRLAAEYSQSEWRHKSGHLGFVTPGQFDAGFEEVIFSLPEGVPSEPVRTSDGMHLFFVETILPRQEMSFDEAAPKLHESMMAALYSETVAAIAADAVDPVQAMDREIFSEKMNASPQAVLMETDGYLLNVQEFVARLRRSPEFQASRRAPMAMAYGAYEQMVTRENAYRVCLSEGIEDDPRYARRMQSWEEAAITAMQRQQLLRELALSDESALRAFYEGHSGQFSREPAWSLRRLIVPLGENASATMARMERDVASGIPLDTIQDHVGGEIEIREEMVADDLKVIDPLLPALVAKAGVGQRTAPYRTSDSLEVVEVTSIRDPTVLPFEDARERVAGLYAAQHAQQLYEELVSQLLGSEPLLFNDVAIADLSTMGVPDADISVEELEELLGTLEE